MSAVNRPKFILWRDIETYSRRKLKDCGTYPYAEDVSTKALLIPYAVNDGATKIWKAGDPIPEEYKEAAVNPDWVICGHNDPFDSAIEAYNLHRRFGWPLVPLERHFCSMVMAARAGLPRSLEHAAAVLGLAYQKDKEGARLMRRLTQPVKKRVNGRSVLVEPDWTPEEMARFAEYAVRDVETMRALVNRLSHVTITRTERRIYELDRRINGFYPDDSQGIYIDQRLILALERHVRQFEQEIDGQICTLTEGTIETTTQVEDIKVWLTDHGITLKKTAKGKLSLSKDDIRVLLKGKDVDPLVRQVLELRLDRANAASAKGRKYLKRLSADGRYRGALVYGGTNTGRWAGEGGQIQNSKHSETEDTDTAIATVLNADYATLKAAYPHLLSLAGDLVRSMPCAAPTPVPHVLFLFDYGQIEDRLCAWSSNEAWKLAAYRDYDATGDLTREPFCIVAAALLDLPEGSLTKKANPVERDTGKVFTHASNYGGTVGAVRRNKSARKLNLGTDADIKVKCKKYRDRHPALRKLWRAIDSAAREAVLYPGKTVRFDARFSFICAHGTLWVRLPSGHKIPYPEAKLVDAGDGNKELISKHWNRTKKRWLEQRLWYGTLTNNIIQALARDLMAEAMLRLHDAGFKIIAHIHDEIIVEIPEDQIHRAEEFKKIVLELPSWAEGLPVTGEMKVSRRFDKSAVRPNNGILPVIQEQQTVGVNTQKNAVNTRLQESPVAQAQVIKPRKPNVHGLRVLDLFSGIGMFSLGLERAGMRTVAFCEVEPFPRAVLNKHWPNVPIYSDVRSLTADRLKADGIDVDLICGGFPCQDISSAGKRIGIDGERSGLWREFARLISEVRPRYVIVENVSALRKKKGLDRVISDLDTLGYMGEWHCIPASALGAPHQRDRIWIIAQRSGMGLAQHLTDELERSQALLHATSEGLEGSSGPGGQGGANGSAQSTRSRSPSWAREPDISRVVNGLPNGVDRIKALGNSLVPQIPEMIGRAILAAETGLPLQETVAAQAQVSALNVSKATISGDLANCSTTEQSKPHSKTADNPTAIEVEEASAPAPQAQNVADWDLGDFEDDIDVLKASIPLTELMSQSLGYAITEGSMFCPFHEDKNKPSLLVKDDHYYCFQSACVAHRHGDHISWLRDYEGLSFGEALEVLHDWDGPVLDAATIEQRAAREATRRLKYMAIAAKIWNGTLPLTRTLGEKFLVQDREIDLSRLPSFEHCLRFSSRCGYGKGKPWRSCVVGLFTDIETDEPAGVHLIGLTNTGHKYGDPKSRTMGAWSPRHRAIKLMPLRGPVLVVGEGIETVLSAMDAGRWGPLSLRPAWALATSGALENFPVLAGIEHLIILEDHDDAGRKAADACQARWEAASRQVTRLKSPIPGEDANDMIRRLRGARRTQNATQSQGTAHVGT